MSFSGFIFRRAFAALWYFLLTGRFCVLLITLWSCVVYTWSDVPLRHFGTFVLHLVLVFSWLLLCMPQSNLLISISSSLPASRARFPRFGSLHEVLRKPILNLSIFTSPALPASRPRFPRFGLPPRSTTKTYPKPIDFHLSGPPGLQGQISLIWPISTKQRSYYQFGVSLFLASL